MKVEIDKLGTLVITAETIEEAFALKFIIEDETRALEHKVFYDMRILENDES
jgi:predicted transcriptional regulator